MNLWTRLFRGRQFENELDEELRTHLNMAAADRVDRGEPPAKAAAAARREFGNHALIRETTRQMWGWTRLELLLRDVKFALRLLRRNPCFPVMVMLSLGSGVGVNAA